MLWLVSAISQLLKHQGLSAQLIPLRKYGLHHWSKRQGGNERRTQIIFIRIYIFFFLNLRLGFDIHRAVYWSQAKTTSCSCNYCLIQKPFSAHMGYNPSGTDNHSEKHRLSGGCHQLSSAKGYPLFCHMCPILFCLFHLPPTHPATKSSNWRLPICMFFNQSCSILFVGRL